MEIKYATEYTEIEEYEKVLLEHKEQILSLFSAVSICECNIGNRAKNQLSKTNY